MPYNNLKQELSKNSFTWLITGAAGFIGSHLVENLLSLNQTVIGLDNLATGFEANLEEVKKQVSPKQWARFHFIKGDIRDLETCKKACSDVDYVLHQAALGSVPRSIEDPITTNAANITGFLNMMTAARDAKVKRFVYAASSSTYGDHPALPKVEEVIGKPLSPYAVTKYVNELYADVFAKTYGFETIGLRYFNVFGPRQHPNGAYAAVIPKWINNFINGDEIHINGDGNTSRDFCFIANVVQANLLAAMTERTDAINQVYNVAVGDRTSLNDLYGYLSSYFAGTSDSKSVYLNFRKGDVAHSMASIKKAIEFLGYAPTHTIVEGLKLTVEWYRNQYNATP